MADKFKSYLDLQLHSGQWEKRWFVLTSNNDFAFYLTSLEQENRGSLDLKNIRGCQPLPSEDDKLYIFSVELSDNNFLMVNAETKENRDEWIRHLTGTQANAVRESQRNIPSSHVVVRESHVRSVDQPLPTTIITNHIIQDDEFCGWLKKRTEILKQWKKRFFVLGADRKLRYYKDETRQELKNEIPLDVIQRLKPVDDKKYGHRFTFELISEATAYILSADSEEDRQNWMLRVEAAFPDVRKLVPLKEGGLTKRSNVRRRWKNRWFMLWGGWLFYFLNREDCERFRRNSFFSDKEFRSAFDRYVKGAMNLKECTINTLGTMDKFKNVFVLSSIKDDRKLYLVPRDENDGNLWIEAIKGVQNGTITITNTGNSKLYSLWHTDFTESAHSLSSARSLNVQDMYRTNVTRTHVVEDRRFSTGHTTQKQRKVKITKINWHETNSFPFRLLKRSFRTFDRSGEGQIDIDDFLRICRDCELDMDHKRLIKLFELLDLNDDGFITFSDFQQTFIREQQAHPDLTPRELILQYLTTHEEIEEMGRASYSPDEESDAEGLHRAVMIEGVPPWFRENDKLVMQLEEIIFREYAPLQTEIVGDCLEIIFAHDIKTPAMLIMEKDLKDLLTDFARDQKEKQNTKKHVKVRSLTAAELKESMQYNEHLYQVEEEEESGLQGPDYDEIMRERMLLENLTRICNQINISDTGYLRLPELLVFFAKLQAVPLSEVPLDHPVMRRLAGCTIPQAVDYLKSVDRRVLHIPAMLESSATMEPDEVAQAKLLINEVTNAQYAEDVTDLDTLAGTETLLEESHDQIH